LQYPGPAERKIRPLADPEQDVLKQSSMEASTLKRVIRPPRILFISALVLVYTSSVMAEQIPLTSTSRLELKNAQAEVTTHHGLQALKLTEKDPGPGEAFAIVKDLTFRNGTIDVEVSGAPAKGAPDFARGFIGVVFRMQADGTHFEDIYVRPSNARADNQLQRNHTTQYMSSPDWSWQRLRQETPGVYESYVDMAPGEWTRLRIVVKGTDASLYVGNAAQPCLLVHDLKLGEKEGSVALWIGPGTEGYFRNLTITGDTGTVP
jgi:hypothetical protein